MVVWITGEDTTARRFVESWSPSLFVACSSPNELASLSRSREIEPYIEDARIVRKYETIVDQQPSDVLELRVRDALKLQLFATITERSKPFGYDRPYNVDVPPAQSYLYQRDLFPLARCEVQQDGSSIAWTLRDDVRECDYEVPPLSSVELKVRGIEARRHDTPPFSRSARWRS